jgi:C1A family cysteine protease
MNESIYRNSLGWLPDYPDFRDYTVEHDDIKGMLRHIGVIKVTSLPGSVDLRPWCSPIEAQGELGSCTAHAGVGMVEYFEIRAFGKHVVGSRLFLYKVTRNLLHWTGDSGAFTRSMMGALVLFGLVPEEYWPYNIADFDKEPTAFCYAYAQNFQSIDYYRLDPPGITPIKLLNQIKINISAGLPAICGFTIYSSYLQGKVTGKIPFPTADEKIIGGHAVMVVGYDDNLKIKNSNIGSAETTGAFLIRNSWGTEWGIEGYGWLPYQYVIKRLAIDWWSLLKNEWVDTGAFKA